MAQLAEIVTESLGCDFRDAPGAGAAGGLGFGLMSFCGAQMRSGFELVAQTLGLEEKIAAADLVITGEGRLDEQTLEGKGPAGIAELARRHGKPVLALAGSIADDSAVDTLFDAVLGIIDGPISLEAALDRGAANLERAAERLARLLIVGKRL